MSLSLPLVLKSAAVAVTGAVAFIVSRHLHREDSLASLRRDIRDALDAATPSPPPAILVTGLRSHGRSAFINTACRVLAGESGPLLLRAETAPPGSTPATIELRAIRAEMEGEGEEAEAVELVDGPALPEAGKVTRADVEMLMKGGGGAPAAECVVMVVRCGGPAKERPQVVKKLTDIASIVRERGLHLVIVLTHKKSLKGKKQAEELRKEVSFRARTDCVYFIENYVASKTQSFHHPVSIKNDYETHITMLAIVRQCVQFTLLYRNHLCRKGKPNVELTDK